MNYYLFIAIMTIFSFWQLTNLMIVFADLILAKLLNVDFNHHVLYSAFLIMSIIFSIASIMRAKHD